MAWPKSSKSILTPVLRALAISFQQSDSEAIGLMIAAFRGTATSVVSEWEAALALPNDCPLGEINSIAKRQAAIVAKLITTGEKLTAYFITIAKTLDYEIRITQYRQASAGMSVCGDASNGENWPLMWLVTAPETNPNQTFAGRRYCGDPHRSWDNRQLAC